MAPWPLKSMAILCGINPTLEALKAVDCRVERVCVRRGQRSPRIQELIDLTRTKGIALSFEAREWLDRKSEGQRHQGVLCYVAEMATFEIDDILEQATPPGLLMILDGIEDPHNLGAILRSAEVAGAHGVFLPRRRSAALNAAAVKASAGAASHVKLARVPNVAQLLGMLKEKGYWIAGLDAESGRTLWEADFTVPSALVFGNEGTGMHRLVREKCDFLAGIPVRGKVRSYNVSVAAGIVLYEVIRQRLTKIDE